MEPECAVVPMVVGETDCVPSRRKDVEDDERVGLLFIMTSERDEEDDSLELLEPKEEVASALGASGRRTRGGGERTLMRRRRPDSGADEARAGMEERREVGG